MSIITKHQSNKYVYLAWSTLACLGYFVIAHFSLKLALINQNVSPLWPPTGFSILITILFGKRYLPSIFIGAWLANMFTGSSVVIAGVIAVGNTCEAFLGAGIALYFWQQEDKYGTFSWLIGFFGLSMLAPIISASAGVFALYFAKIIALENLKTAWVTWWVGDAVGAMLIVPLMYLFSTSELKKNYTMLKRRTGEVIINLGLILVSLYLVYWLIQDPFSIKYLFLIFPTILLFSRLKSKIVNCLGVVLVTAIVLVVTLQEKGPFNLASLNQNLVNLEIFLIAYILSNAAVMTYHTHRSFRVLRYFMMFGWIFWGLIFYKLQEAQIQENHKIIETSVTHAYEEIQRSYFDRVGTMHSAAALFMASDNVTPEDWKVFVEQQKIYKNLGGIKKLEVIKKIESFSNQELRTAAMTSMLTGKVVLSEDFMATSEVDSRSQMAIFVPVYKNRNDSHATQDLKNRFSHWIFVAATYEDFFIPQKNTLAENLNVEVFSANEYSNLPLFQFGNSEVVKSYQPIVKSIVLGNRSFVVRWSVTSNLFNNIDIISAWMGFFGAISVLILGLFVVNIIDVRNQAREIANRIHHEYLKTQQQLKIQEAKVFESAKMASLGEMAAGIAHEINNPLAIIASTASQIEKLFSNRSGENLTDQATVYTKRIKFTVERISKIVKSLRQFARDGERDPFEKVKLDKIIEDVLSLCAEKFKNAEIGLQVINQFHDEIECREVQLSQVLLNLLSNAFDAVQVLEKKWVKIEVKELPDFVLIRVIDSGIGIPLELQNKILEPFFTTKEVGKGTGLGLSMSKGIVESQNGILRIDNNCENTCLEVRLPKLQTEVEGKKSA